MAVLAGRSGRYLFLYGGPLLLAIAVGAALAYSERFGGDNGPYILLGVLLAIAAAVAILLQWRLGALLLVATLPYSATINFGPLASGAKALSLLTFVSLVMALLTYQKLFERFVRLWEQPLVLAVLAFVLWSSFSILWASDKGETLRATFELLRRHRMTAFLLAPVFVYGIFATASRTGLIALVATPLLALFVPRLGARLGWRILPMYVLGAAAIAVTVLAIPSVAEIALKRDTALSQVQSEETWSGRWSNWQGALDVTASHPILGVGAGNYAEANLGHSEKGFKQSLQKGKVAGLAHNIFLSVATQLGLVGLILWLGILFFLFKTAVPIAPEAGLGASIFLGLIVSMLAGMTLTWESEKMVYVLFGSVLALQLHIDSARRVS